MYIQYEQFRFTSSSRELIDQANQIITEYEEAGFVLTLRQLYYQFVARDLLPNTVRSYKNLGNVINKARLAGEISWEAIEDRTRNLETVNTWPSPKSIMGTAALSYCTDKWADQDVRIEVWIEKEALVGVISGVCEELEVPYFACRGYNSQSEQWRAGQRFKGYIENGQRPVVLHLGDHDPSGIDMTRDNRSRLHQFAEGPVEIVRLALNYDQIERFRPPPNPAKQTDSRFERYSEEFGDESWELDALEPQLIVSLVRHSVLDLRDEGLWNEAVEKQEAERRRLYDAIKYVE